MDRCRTCGTRSAEWNADAGAYVAALRWCKGCAAIQRQQQRLDAGEGPKLPGLSVVLQRPPEPEPAPLAPIPLTPATTVNARGVVIVG